MRSFALLLRKHDEGGLVPEKKALEVCCVKVQKQRNMKITWSLLFYGSSS